MLARASAVLEATGLGLEPSLGLYPWGLMWNQLWGTGGG